MTVDRERKIISIVFVGGHLLACALVGIFLLAEWIDSTDATLFVSIAVLHLLRIRLLFSSTT